MNYRLQKRERLHAQKSIKELFSEGSSFFLYPFKVLYLKKGGEETESTQVLFSVSKKKIKSAVKRNFVKRRMREAYRLNKHSLQNPLGPLYIGLVYVASEPMDYASISSKVSQVLSKLNSQISEPIVSHE